MKLALLFGGSALVTLAYVAGRPPRWRHSGGERASRGGRGLSGRLHHRRRLSHPGRPGRHRGRAVAGLTGVGISSGAAVSAVLAYRLATYWLPVVPGWLSWRLLQRLDYV